MASQSSSNSQILPISLGLGAAVPVNANVPVGVLSGGPVQGAVTQEGRARSDGSAKNHEATQSVRQQGAGGNTASQATSSSQILPISLGLGAAVPVNANVPVGVLSGGPVQGVVDQTGDAKGTGEAHQQRDQPGHRAEGRRARRQLRQPVGQQLADPPDRARRRGGPAINANVPSPCSAAARSRAP